MNIRKIAEGAKFEIPDEECDFSYDNPKAYYGRDGWYMFNSDGFVEYPDDKYLVFPTENFLDDEKCLKVIIELDEYVQGVDQYCFGLPSGTEDVDVMKNIIRHIITE